MKHNTFLTDNSTFQPTFIFVLKLIYLQTFMSKGFFKSSILMTVLFAVATCLFFGIAYPHHLHFQEQYQLFQSTWSYFHQVARMPGGYADWLGRFFTQYFYNSWSGAVLISLLLTAIQILTWCQMPRKTPLLYAISFIPAAALLVFLCDENALMGAVVAILIAELVSFLLSLIKADSARRFLEFAIIPLLFHWLGSLSIVYILLTASREKKFWLSAAGIGVFLLCPIVASWFYPQSLRDIAEGIHYHRIPGTFATWPWIAAATIILSVYVAKFRFPELRTTASRVIGIMGFMIICAGTWYFVRSAADMAKEKDMKYDYLAGMEMWNETVAVAEKDKPTDAAALTCLNIALAQDKLMSSHMFDYEQSGADGLLPRLELDHVSPLAVGEALYQIGMTSTAQRYFFEAQECIPDLQKSARLHKRLVETNLINGNYYVALKFLEPLKYARNYKHWARETEELLAEPDSLVNHPVYGRFIAERFRKNDFIFDYSNMGTMLKALCQENKKNDLAFDYLLSWNLLNKDLTGFVEGLSLNPKAVKAKHYQEAVMLNWSLNHEDGAEMPSTLRKDVAQRFSRFMADRSKGEEYCKEKYGDTYWFYYYYGSK